MHAVLIQALLRVRNNRHARIGQFASMRSSLLCYAAWFKKCGHVCFIADMFKTLRLICMMFGVLQACVCANSSQYTAVGVNDNVVSGTSDGEHLCQVC